MAHKRARPYSEEPTRRFLRDIVVVLVCAVIATVSLAYRRTFELLNDAALMQARSLSDLIVTTRSWNAAHGGVWVVKQPGVDTNPFLSQLGVSADTTTTDGRVLTLRNPSLMTAEISVMLGKDDGAVFRLTSLKPVNPANAPDSWERSSLEHFGAGRSERWQTVRTKDGALLRYMRPLLTEEGCLRCHGRQGYKVGDIRGAVSVMVPLDEVNRSAAVNALSMILIGGLTTAALVWIAWALTRRLRLRLDEAQAALVEAATTDPLTGVANRRETMERLSEESERARREGHDIGLLMLDIDHFKKVNDRYGHAVGDAVLAEVAARVSGIVRPYDTFGRIGGEEFLIVAPGIGLDEAVQLAERARAEVSASPIPASDADVTVTVSIGVTSLRPSSEDGPEAALALADTALYRAKEDGRDRVAAVPS